VCVCGGGGGGAGGLGLFFKHHAMKAFGRVKLQLYALLISALGGGKWTALRSSRFNSRKDLRLLSS
jgi:hypothetical protein